MEDNTTDLVQKGHTSRFVVGLIITLMISVPASYAVGNALFSSESLESQQLRLEGDYVRQTSIIERSIEQKEGLLHQVGLIEENISDATDSKWSTEFSLAKVKLQIELKKDSPDKEVLRRLADKILDLGDVFDDVFTMEQASQ